MRVGEALSKRALIIQQLGDLNSRIQNNATVQQGDSPYEDPKPLISEYEKLSDELTDIVNRLNKTNNNARLLDGGLTLGEALQERGRLMRMRSFYTRTARSGIPSQLRYSMSEIKMESIIPVAEFNKKAEELTEQIRTLDALIQETNWNTELQ